MDLEVQCDLLLYILPDYSNLINPTLIEHSRLQCSKAMGARVLNLRVYFNSFSYILTRLAIQCVFIRICTVYPDRPGQLRWSDTVVCTFFVCYNVCVYYLIYLITVNLA